MGIERRQGTVYQLSLLEWRKETVRPAALVKAEPELGRARSSHRV